MERRWIQVVGERRGEERVKRRNYACLLEGRGLPAPEERGLARLARALAKRVHIHMGGGINQRRDGDEEKYKD